MPLPKKKSCPSEGRKIAKKAVENFNICKENDNSNNAGVKTEQPENMESSSNKIVPDLNKFKFAKRAPVKIEYEKASPVKEVST